MALLSLALTGAAWAVAAHDGPGRSGMSQTQQLQQTLMALTFPVLGALLLATSRRSGLAWVFSIIGLTRAVALVARAWAVHDYLSGGSWPVPRLLAFVSVAMLFAGPLLAPLTLLWFPNGRDGTWRRATALPAVAGIGLTCLLVGATAVPGRALVDDSPAPAGLASFGMALFILATIAGVLVGLAFLLVRLRGADLVARQQVKWYLFGATVAAGLNVTGDALPHASVLNLAGTVAFEGAVLIAVRRYALWNIDLLLRRTIVYGLLSISLAAVYTGTVVGLGLLLSDLSVHRDLAVAAATLASAALFAPARAWLQSRVDQRFDRREYEAVRRVRDHPALTAADGPVRLQHLLREVLRDPSLQLVFEIDSSVLDVAGKEVDLAGSSSGLVGTDVAGHATLLHRPVAAANMPVFESVLHAAAGPAAIARLLARLLAQVTEVEQSRLRIVEAADEQRRRIERDLHDGAQQRLVALALRLRGEQRRHTHELGPMATRIIDFGVAEIRGSVEDLRALAAGILPGSLVSEGLGAALGELVDRSPKTVTGTRDLDHRHAPHVEATAWFVAAEALANSFKHAPGAALSLCASCDGSTLQLTVQDDGPGGAREGGGLLGLDDRVRSCAGTLVLDSPRGVGTRLSAALPCG